MSKSIGNKTFSLQYSFFDETQETELSMIIDEENILAYQKNGKSFTTRWNLDELAFWLRDFLDNMQEDPYPVDTAGEFAAMKDISAREFDSDNEAEFDDYYDRLDEWNLHHRWHTASSGAILADLYFQLVEDYVEISWNNEDSEEDVTFNKIIGGKKIPKELFTKVINEFLQDYAKQWFN